MAASCQPAAGGPGRPGGLPSLGRHLIGSYLARFPGPPPLLEMLVLSGDPPGQVAKQQDPRAPLPEGRLRRGGRAEARHAHDGHAALAALADNQAGLAADRDERLRIRPGLQVVHVEADRRRRRNRQTA